MISGRALAAKKRWVLDGLGVEVEGVCWPRKLFLGLELDGRYGTILKRQCVQDSTDICFCTFVDPT